MKNKSIFVFLLGCLCLNVLSENIDKLHFPIVNFSREQYGAGTQNWDIVQQRNGWIYVANNYGMMEFDGKKWNHFPVANESNVRALCIGEHGRIYAGASKEFGYFEPDENGLQRYVSLLPLLPEDNRPIDIIWRIHSLEQGYCFVTEKREVFYYHNNEISVWQAPGEINYSAVLGNTLYVATTRGLFHCVSGRFMPIPQASVLKDKKVCGISDMPGDRLLIATDNAGFFLYNNQSVERWQTDADEFLKTNLMYCMDTSDDYIAIGTVKSGVVVIDKQGHIYRKMNKKSGLQNNTILSTFFDKDQSLWLGLDSGVDVVCMSSPITDIYESGSFYGAGYCSLLHGDRLYLGTNQGLYYTQWPIKGGNPSLIEQVSGLSGQVWNLQVINGELFCSHHDGVFIIKKNRAEKIGSLKGVWKLMKWSDDLLLAGTYDGFYTLKYEQGRWLQRGKIAGFDESCRIMEWDADGSLWMSHGNIGVFRFRFNGQLDAVISKHYYGVNEGLPSTINNAVYKVDNEIIFTTSQGVFRYNAETHTIEKKPARSAYIPDNVNFSLVQKDDAGGYWYVAANALGYYANIGGGSENLFGLFQNKMIGGFEHLDFVMPGMAILANENGFSLININQIKPGTHTSKTIIRDIHTTYPVDSLVFGNNDFDRQCEVVLPYTLNSFRIGWATPNYEKYTNTEYSYCLEGSAQNEWSEWSPEAQKEYTNLSDGTYLFKVRTRNIFMDEISETSINLVITAPWYRNNYAKLFYFILIAGCVAAAVFWMKRNIARNKKRIEEESRAELEKKEQKIEAMKAEKLAVELQMKNQELSNSIMNVIRKNEILLDIKNEIAAIYTLSRQKDSATVLRKLLELQTSIGDNISYDNEWEKFEKNFNLANSDYLKRLQREFPGFTLQDKKLCIFLKMNLTTKEIAPLLNISVRGVEISRYRLRKKLNLDRNISLIEFLQSYSDTDEHEV